jgi:hypothetical protein
VEGVLAVDGEGAAALDSLADGHNSLADGCNARWSGHDEEDDLNKTY